MLRLVIPEVEVWDDEKQEFVIIEKEQTLQLEHSLVSLSKWESKWCIPFLSQDTRSTDETLDYIRCMTITQNVPDSAYDRITDEHINKVNEYIGSKMTATWFSDKRKNGGGKRSNEIVTSELIYYWMIAYNIPDRYDKWHLNRLLTLIRICEEKNNPSKNKMSTNEMYRQQKELNDARRKASRMKG